LDLGKRLSNLLTNKAQDFENKVYGFDVLELIHEVVKVHKKNLPPVDLELLKRKKLDAQEQSGNKFTAPSNKFNQGWGRKPQVKQLGRNNDNRQSSNRPQPPPVLPSSQLSRPLVQPVQLIQPVPVLHKAENAWKPKLRGKDSKLNDEEAKYEKFRKSVRSLLNKITPTTYAEIVGKFVELNVGQNEHSCKVAVGLIFDKAVEEPTFCGMYTDLCKNQFNVEGGRKEEGSFFYTLVQKVQSTFEGNSEIDKQIKER